MPNSCLIDRRFPIHVVNLIEGPQDCFRIAMAIEAPLHQQCVRLKNQGHLVHGAVASRAANAFAQVNAVIEVCEISEPMYLNPLDRFIRTVTFAHGFQVVRIFEQD